MCAAACGAFFLYISSDYVFDGRNPPYGEDDVPNPLNVYGRTKLEGERETLRHCPGTVLSVCLTDLSSPVCLSTPASLPLLTCLSLNTCFSSSPHLSVSQHLLLFLSSPVCLSGAVVLRVPVLFGEVESVMESAVTSLWVKVQEATESCTLDHCQQRFPTDTRDVAAVCRKLSERARQVSVREETDGELSGPVCLTACLSFRTRLSEASFTSRLTSR